MSDRIETLDNREIARLIAAANGVGGLSIAGLVATGEMKLAVVALLATLALGAVSALGTLFAAGGKVAQQLQSGLERRQLIAARAEDRRAGTLAVVDTPGALSDARERSS